MLSLLFAGLRLTEMLFFLTTGSDTVQPVQPKAFRSHRLCDSDRKGLKVSTVKFLAQPASRQEKTEEVESPSLRKSFTVTLGLVSTQ